MAADGDTFAALVLEDEPVAGAAELLDDLGEVGSELELFSLHVPPGGRAALAMRRSDTSARQVSLTAMGLGFGGGRSLTIAIEEDIPERGECMRVLQGVTLHVRRFAGDGTDPLVMTDVVGWGSRRLQAWADCPHCGVAGDGLPPLQFEEDAPQGLDLRGFDSAVTRTTEVTLDGTLKAELGVKVPVPHAGEVGAGISFERRTSIACTASYTFPAGAWFVPYRPRGEPSALPYWALR